ncbi:FimB/Mfa2 family fimbrial subunit [uncultured Porphyromonas sp.]|uniref:FimB/Mfa2 family fimbrial subunit n=1 Tax=uncultured Porphyromonas sp. TaxID=159274 RepID=UPI00262490CF|nr:FimB/Mfa2 family fimbrial subunit [uncultured Porphyromonas sp.]
MITKRFFWTLVSLILPTSLLLSSCLRDDLSKCYTNRIALSYHADGTTEVLPKYIKTVQLYIYEANSGKLIERQDINTDTPSDPTPIVKFNLKQGVKYKVVAIGNVSDKTLIKGTDSSLGNSITLGEPNAFNGKESGINDHLYLGSALIEGREAFNSQIDYVRLYSIHYNIYVGLDKENFDFSKNQYQWRIGLVPGLCDGAGNTLTDKVTYLFEDFKEDERGRMAIPGAMLRFDPNSVNQITFELIEKTSNRVLHSLNLGDYLRTKATDVDLTKQEMDITFFYSCPGTEIQVAPWTAADVNPIF